MFESRIREQIKIYRLILNPVTANYESTNLLAIAASEEELEEWYKGELAEEKYIDNGYTKSFKKGSPLEMYNPVEFGEHTGIAPEWTTLDGVKTFIEQAQSSYGFIAIPILVNCEEYFL